LKKKLALPKEVFVKPPTLALEDLFLVHTRDYIRSLSDPKKVAQIAEMSFLQYVPAFILEKKLLQPMQKATAGTIMALEEVCLHSNNFVVNLSGGYHHAKTNSGEGFCFYADISIALEKIWQQKPNHTFLIIDLDAHQGNGLAETLSGNSKVRILDIYNQDIYPMDFDMQEYIHYNYPILGSTSESEYLDLLHKELQNILHTYSPDAIVYNAGTDVYKEDNLGQMEITTNGIWKRDEIVAKMARDSKIPLVMVLSGGYTQASWKITGESILRLYQNWKQSMNR
jgi:histone deacetylase 11